MSSLFNRQMRELLLIGLPIVLLVVGAFALAYQFVEPAPPKTIVMATGGARSGYTLAAREYQKTDGLVGSGIKLEIRETAGSIENIAKLMDPKSDVSVAIVQGGLLNTNDHPSLVSLGQIFVEPMWVFLRADLDISRLSELAGRKISAGADGSGTRVLAVKLLETSKLDASKVTIVPVAGAKAGDALIAGEIDAAFFTFAPESELAQKLLRSPKVKLLDMKQAEAYTRHHPYLSRVVLPAGVIDFQANIPATDTTLVAPIASLIARSDIHPAHVSLLVDAAKTVHSRPGLLQKPGEFPIALSAELPLSADAARAHKNGLGFLQRYLPFWLATFLDRMLIMIIPLATILLPLFKIVPMAYQWSIRRRIMFWYDELKKLERQVRADRSAVQIPAYRDEIHRIEEAVAIIPVPMMYSDQLYSLRSAVELVRQKISAMDGSRRGPVEPSAIV
jgi:TRAP transporter TAXI family solute receptor